mgnify:CR=1 FL=1
MSDNKYDLATRLYGTTSAYSHYTQLLGATKTVITVQDFDSPQVLLYRKVAITGPDLDSPNLQQLRKASVSGPAIDTAVVKSTRYYVITAPISSYAKLFSTYLGEVVSPADSIRVAAYRRYLLQGTVNDSVHMQTTTMAECSTWVPNSVQAKTIGITGIQRMSLDSVHVPAIRRYLLSAAISDSAHMLSPTVVSVSTAVPDDVAVKTSASSTIGTMTSDGVHVADVRRYSLYAIQGDSVSLWSASSVELSYRTPGATVDAASAMTVAQVSPGIHVAGYKRYVLACGMTDTVANMCTSVTELSTQDPPQKIRNRFSYAA